MHVYSNSSKTVWRRWACRQAQTVKHRRSVRSHPQWRMSKIRVVMEVSLSISPARLGYFRTRSAHLTALLWTWHRSHRRHRLHNLSNRSRSTSRLFLRNHVCRSSIRSAQTSIQWALWPFKCAFRCHLHTLRSSSTFLNIEFVFQNSKTLCKCPREISPKPPSNFPCAKKLHKIREKKKEKRTKNATQS